MEDAFLSVATELAERADVVARQYFRQAETSWKSDNTPVTEADIAINQLVIDTISQRFPTHGIVGEEASLLTDGAEWVWVCDPIDGTIPYALGVPTSAFSLALTRNGEVVLGVASDFHAERLFTAVQGEGAYLNGTRLEPSRIVSLRSSVTDIEGIWMRGMNEDIDLTRFPALLEREGSKVLKVCSMVYAGLMVATGQLAGMISRGDKPWDVAALKVIVEEAGGRVTDLYGENPRWDGRVRGCIVSAAGVHADYRKLVAEAAAG
ncbi:MAG: inositol monophosphatase [Armatimonas sp.]